MTRVLLRSLKAVGSGIRTGWLILGITLALLIGGEVGLRLALETRLTLDTENRSIPAKKWRLADIYQDAEWARGYFREHRTVTWSSWLPYVYWRRSPHQGRYINVNRDGRRATWNPPPRDIAGGPPPVRVFTFGGSAMWGWGARDDHTIASYLSELLHAKGYHAEVTNYSELAFSSPQEVLELLRCLYRGDVPDIAIFYDGHNDVYWSHKEGGADIFLRREDQYAESGLLSYFWGLRRFAAGLGRRLRPRTPMATGPIASRPTLPVNDKIARQTAHMYESNLALIEFLGRRHGFDPLFYWQPIIFSKRHRSPHEQTMAERASMYMKILTDGYRRVRQSEALNNNPRFHDISDLFDDAEESYYLDRVHLSEPGNRLIAEAMVDDVIELIEQRRAAEGPGQRLSTTDKP